MEANATHREAYVTGVLWHENDGHGVHGPMVVLGFWSETVIVTTTKGM